MMYDLLVERMLNGLAKNKTINDLAKKHKVSVAILKSQLKKEEVFIRRKFLSDYIGEKDIFDLSENIEDQSKNSENIFEEINANSDNKNLEEEKKSPENITKNDKSVDLMRRLSDYLGY